MIELKREHATIVKEVQSKLIKSQGIPFGASIFKQYSTNLMNYFQQCYFTPLSFKDQIQSQQQARTVRSIRGTIKKKNLIIRLTDKGNNFYIGSKVEFEKKVQQFFSETNAFIRLSYNPFNDILNRVIQLLNNLRTKKLIFQWQYNKMIPDKTKCELSHLYFNPKTHKVGRRQF